MSGEEWVGMTLFIAVGLVWCSTAIQSHRLYLYFWGHFPDHAPLYMDPPGNRDYRKLTFFLDGQHEQLLRSDPVLWAMRQRLMQLLIASGIAPAVMTVGGVLGVFLFGKRG